ncbi:MAG: hypothetical protein JWP03_1047 [Phycisphaerales bacterium]|nr:hypothetical protein [Phycisphaerales bacterium]
MRLAVTLRRATEGQGNSHAANGGHQFCVEAAMPSGQVKWFDAKKGFGFILGPEGQDVFVHFSSIAGDGFRALKDGEVVEYDIIRGDKGFSAQKVKRAAATPVTG